MKLNNNVELLGWYGGDKINACSAWTSTSRNLTDEKIGRIPQLLKMLAEQGHHTPFEKSIVHFLVSTDIATHIQLCKHRISSMNAECLSGDNNVYFENNRGKRRTSLTVLDLYNRWNTGRPHQDTLKDKIYSKKRLSKMRLRVLDEFSGNFIYSSIKDIFSKGVKPIYKITLENGNFIKCTNNHYIYTNDGYKSLSTGLIIGDLVGCNGIKINIKNKPWTFKDFYRDATNYTRHEFAKINDLKYELIKKWGYVFNISFKENPNRSFKIGAIPWNKNKKGYKIDIKNRKRNPKKGADSSFWRGGSSTERELIGAWTTSQSAKVHKKYLFTCQKCKINSSQKLHAHHIIPVIVDISKAYNFDNLITLCQTCHSSVHKTSESERAFASLVLSKEFVPSMIDWTSTPKRKNGKLYVYYSKVTSIEFLGEEEVFDIEVQGKNNNFIANGIVVHNSARYKELKEDKFYIPNDWPETWQLKLEEHTKIGLKLYHEAIEDLTKTYNFSKKRAKESSRFFRSYNTQIEADIMFNWRSFMNFLNLRNTDDAQKEIREIAKEMLECIKRVEGNPFKYTLEAFNITD